MKRWVLAVAGLAVAGAVSAFAWGLTRLVREMAPPSWDGAFRGLVGGEGPVYDGTGTFWPSGLGEMELRLGRLVLPDLSAEGFRVALQPRSAAAAARGEFARIVIEFTAVSYRGLTLRDVSLDCREARVDLERLLEKKELRFSRLTEVRPAGRLDAAELAKFFSIDGVRRVRAVSGGLEAEGRWRGFPWTGRVEPRLVSGGDAVLVRWTAFRWAGIPALAWLLNRMGRTYALLPTDERPFRIRVQSLIIGPDAIVIQ